MFFAVIMAVSGHGDELVELSYADIKSTIGYRHTTDKDFCDWLNAFCKKLASIHFTVTSDCGFVRIPIFATFSSRIADKTLKVATNKYFVPFFNDLFGNFTVLNYQTFAGLASKYSKTLYRNLLQYKNGDGWWRVDIGTFRELFDVPASYDGNKIVDKIVKPAVKELSACFESLDYELERLPARGSPLAGIKFIFTF